MKQINIQSDKKGRFEFEVNEGWWAISGIFHVIDSELLPLLITGSMWPILLQTRRGVSPSSTRWTVIGLYVSSDYASLVKANELCSFYILRKFWGFIQFSKSLTQKFGLRSVRIFVLDFNFRILVLEIQTLKVAAVTLNTFKILISIKSLQ